MDRLRAREIKAYEDYILETHRRWSDEGHAEELVKFGRQNDPSFNLTSEDILYMMTIKGVHQHIRAINYKYDQIAGPSHYWIGINPPPGTVTVLQLYQKTEQLFARYKMFEKGYLYCIETHTENGLRPHIHMIIRDTRPKPSRVAETLAKHYKISENSIERKKYSEGILYAEHVEYIKGNKKASKLDFVQNDEKILSEYNIPKYLGTI